MIKIHSCDMLLKTGWFRVCRSSTESFNPFFINWWKLDVIGILRLKVFLLSEPTMIQMLLLVLFVEFVHFLLMEHSGSWDMFINNQYQIGFKNWEKK